MDRRIRKPKTNPRCPHPVRGAGAAVTGGGPAGGGNAAVAGMALGIGKIPSGAAAMIELTTVPCASQSDRPSSPMM